MANASAWTTRLGRLTSMGSRELIDRLRQQLIARADLLRYRSGYDFAGQIRHEKAELLGRFFFQSAEVPSLCDVLKQVFPSQARDIVFQAEKICRHQFDLLGYENLDYGNEIDWHCDAVHGKQGPRKPWFNISYLDFDEVGDSKITWELNRHQHFVTLAKAYWLTGDDKFAREIFEQWTHWQKENPYPIGMNWASSLEVAFRTLSWVWTYFLMLECPLFTADLRQQWRHALSLNGRHIANYLSTYFSPNTHLLGEAAALFFLGTIFPGPSSALKWREQGWKILLHGARTQVFEDGFYFEQSTYYHVYALDFFLHARILAGLNGVAIPTGFDHTLQQMLNALLLLGRAGIPPRIGDDDGGRLFDPRRHRQEHLLDPLATGAVLFGRGDFKFVAGTPREETLWLLGNKGLDEFESLPSAEPSTDSAALPYSGYYLMADADSARQLLIDAGPLGSGNGGHGHADALSVGLIQDGQNLLMDPGTYEYIGNSGERSRLRGTGAHSTMQVDGQDQAEITGPFSWKNSLHVKVELWIAGQQFDLFVGSHDGYSRLPTQLIHRRWVFHRKGKFWLVVDRAEGSGEHQLDISWHIGSTLWPAPSKEHVFADRQDGLALLTAEQHGWAESVRRDYWSPAYGHRERASVVSFATRLELPADFATLLLAGTTDHADLGRLVRVNSGDHSAPCAFRYTKGPQEHTFVFAHRPEPWTSGPWTSDADFIYWSVDREKEQYSLILCNGSYADAGGRRVLSCGTRIGYAEVSSSAAKVDVFSSAPGQVLLRRPLDTVLTDADLMMRGKDPTKMGV
jgi:heparinase II/III-like protein